MIWAQGQILKISQNLKICDGILHLLQIDFWMFSSSSLLCLQLNYTLSALEENFRIIWKWKCTWEDSSFSPSGNKKYIVGMATKIVNYILTYRHAVLPYFGKRKCSSDKIEISCKEQNVSVISTAVNGIHDVLPNISPSRLSVNLCIKFGLEEEHTRWNVKTSITRIYGYSPIDRGSFRPRVR